MSSSFEAPLLEAAEAQNAALVMTWLEAIYQSVPPAKWDQAAAYWAGNVSGIHNGVPGGLPLDDDKFTMRYLAYTVRVLPPLTVFQSIVQSFLAVQKSTLLNGAQLVGAENNPVSLRDYWLHMQMVRVEGCAAAASTPKRCRSPPVSFWMCCRCLVNRTRLTQSSMLCTSQWVSADLAAAAPACLLLFVCAVQVLLTKGELALMA